jgi:hypothetical protein
MPRRLNRAGFPYDSLADLPTCFPARLARCESAVYDALRARPLQCLTRDDLLSAAGIAEDVTDRMIDTHVKRLRMKKVSGIKTVYGDGYLYDPHIDNYRLLQNGLFEVINTELPHKSSSLLTFEDFVLDTGCKRLFRGREFAELQPEICKAFELFFG